MKNKKDAVITFTVWTVGIILIILLTAGINSINRLIDRSSCGMKYISDDYVYDKDTGIIYEEIFKWWKKEASTSYVPYIDSDGHMYKYDKDTKQWVVIEN